MGRLTERAMQGAERRLKRWTRLEYERLIEKAVFVPGDRVELIDGLLLVAESQSASHYTAIGLVAQALGRAFGEGWQIRIQAPIALDDASEPEPDVAVVRGGPRDYADAHPAEPVLVVEVTLTTLELDRTHKSSLYARAGRPEYWIVDLVDRVLEVRRDPAASPAAAYGWDYATVETLGPASVVCPLAVPTTSILVADLLP
ncbi:MAG: Uma2 family endonuclease [Candidatus Rokuibacteriota bacterium]